MGGNELRAIAVPDARDMRYGEIFLVLESGIEVYNTTGLNDCPAELWDELDLAAIGKEYGALSVQKNGPKFWMMDWQEVHLGKTATFGGLEARWGARVSLSALQQGAEGGKPYEIYMPSKTQKMIYSEGKPVFELVDPAGHAYVLQAHDERFPIHALPSLGDHLSLPEGWRYRSRVLEEDLVLDLTPDTPIHAVGDDFHQYYTRI